MIQHLRQSNETEYDVEPSIILFADVLNAKHNKLGHRLPNSTGVYEL